MKQIFTLVLMGMLSCLGLYAEETRGIKNSIRYITMNDGQVIAIPEKYILGESQDNGICTLTLEGDTTFTYSIGNVANISDKYNGSQYTCKVDEGKETDESHNAHKSKG